MIARIIDNKHIYLANLTVEEESLVDGRFTAEDSRAKYVLMQGSWNGVYRRYDRGKQRLARPFLADLRLFCQEKNLPLIIQDERPPWNYDIIQPEEINNDFLPGIKLENYQLDAIKKACKTDVGLIIAVTGSGKSEIIAGICKAIKCPTVIIADQLIIIDQLKERLELREIIDEVGLFYAGKTPNGQLITIGSIQSLVIPSKLPKKPNRIDYNSDELFNKATTKHEITMRGFKKRCTRAKQFQEIVKKSEMLIVDEADLGTSSSYRYLFRHLFQGRKRFGLTGTIIDDNKPVQALFLRENLGSIIFQVDRKEVERLGRIIPIEYFMFTLGEGGDPKESSAYDIAVNEQMVHNEQYHKIIAAICRAYPNDGTLILVDRDDLGDALQQEIPGSIFIHGKTPMRRRNEVLDSFEKREVKVVIGGKIVQRGLDLKGGCENLIIATGGKSQATLYQRMGRAFRVNKRGRGRIFDFFILSNKYLYSHSRLRLRSVIALGYKTRVVFRDGQQIEGEAFVSSRFRRPKPRQRNLF